MAGDRQHQQTQWGSGAAPFVVFGLALAAVPVFGGLAMVTRSIGPAAIPIWAITFWGAAMIFRGPIGKAIARSIEGPPVDASAEIPAEVYAELDELRARVGELEERVDFSERLLTSEKAQRPEA